MKRILIVLLSVLLLQTNALAKIDGCAQSNHKIRCKFRAFQRGSKKAAKTVVRVAIYPIVFVASIPLWGLIALDDNSGSNLGDKIWEATNF